jgi:hypothetical protein
VPKKGASGLQTDQQIISHDRGAGHGRLGVAGHSDRLRRCRLVDRGFIFESRNFACASPSEPILGSVLAICSARILELNVWGVMRPLDVEELVFQ